MGAMSQLATEKDEQINALHWEYREAFAALMEYQDKTDPSHRTIKQTEELSRLTLICGHAKYLYEIAEMRRYQI